MRFTQSLKKNYQFRTVYKRGKSVANKNLVLYALPNNLGINRLGITVSKKVGNAVVRNRVTRLIRECYRLDEVFFRSGFDLVFIARSPASICTFNDIYKTLRYLSDKLAVWDGLL